VVGGVLTGRSDIKEVDYRFLKRDVITKAIAEIDALCEDFGLELIEHKQGRKIEEIQFRVVPKVQQRLGELNAPNRNVFDLELVGRLIASGIKQEEAQDRYATTDEGQIRAALDHVDQRLRNAAMPSLKSPGAYLKDSQEGLCRADGGNTPAAEREPRTRHGGRAVGGGPVAPHSRALGKPPHGTGACGVQRDARGNASRSAQPLRVGAIGARCSAARARVATRWAGKPHCGDDIFKWLTKETWPEEPTDKVLLDFALQRGVVGV
jgi:Initiator Replication protein